MHFTVDDNSALIVRRDRDGVAYTLFEEHAVRMAVEGMHARITFYKAGRLVEQRLVPLVQPKNPATLAEGSDA